MQKGFLQKKGSTERAATAGDKKDESPNTQIEAEMSKMEIDGAAGSKPAPVAAASAASAETKPPQAQQKPKMGAPTMNIGNQARMFNLGPVRKNPVACIVLGMAGSGKTTLMQRINVHIHQKHLPSYIINLDPAVRTVPYGCNIDIRDTVNYKEVMKQYQLGPNGGIMTALNLFSTKFDQVMTLMEKKADELSYVFLDTPGQIEIFTWSASGSIISDMLAYSFPTVVIYVVDTPRNASPVTFMSNMLYACSIMYKLKLPFILVFNKTDITPADFAMEWMTDYEKFQEAVSKEKAYSGTLSSSMCLVLEEFYKNLRAVTMSAVSGEGIDRLFEAIGHAAQEYADVYRPALEAKAKDKEERERRAVARRLRETRRRMREAGGLDGAAFPDISGGAGAAGGGRDAAAAAGEEEDDDDDSDESDGSGRRGRGTTGVFDQDSDSADEDVDDVEFMREKRDGGGMDMFQAACARQRQDLEKDCKDYNALGELVNEINAGNVRMDL